MKRLTGVLPLLAQTALLLTVFTCGGLPAYAHPSQPRDKSPVIHEVHTRGGYVCYIWENPATGSAVKLECRFDADGYCENFCAAYCNGECAPHNPIPGATDGDASRYTYPVEECR